MRIMAKKAFRFVNPGRVKLSPVLVPGEKPQSAFQYEQSGKAQTADTPLDQRDYFETVPGPNGSYGLLQEAPDWIKAVTPDKINITTFNNAVNDGDIMEVAVLSDMPSSARFNEAVKHMQAMGMDEPAAKDHVMLYGINNVLEQKSRSENLQHAAPGVPAGQQRVADLPVHKGASMGPADDQAAKAEEAVASGNKAPDAPKPTDARRFSIPDQSASSDKATAAALDKSAAEDLSKAADKKAEAATADEAANQASR